MMSSKHSVDSGSYLWVCGETYSDDLKKPKKAVVTAAQSIILSACGHDVESMNEKMRLRPAKVTGDRLGPFLALHLMDLTSM